MYSIAIQLLKGTLTIDIKWTPIALFGGEKLIFGLNFEYLYVYVLYFCICVPLNPRPAGVIKFARRGNTVCPQG